MSKVIKKNGKFILEPDPLLAAKAQHTADIEKVKTSLGEAELRSLLERILLRLEALESGM